MARMPRSASRISALVALISLMACSGSNTGILVPGSTPGAVAGVIVSPSSATVEVGLTAQMTATLVDGNGNEASGDVSWSSSSSIVASVSDDGLVLGLAAGAVTITATVGTVFGGGTVTIVDPPTP